MTAIATDDANQTASDSVSVTVDNTPPTVSISSPSGGAAVSGTITVTASASDATSGVAQVEFFVDGASIGVDDNGGDGWSVNWNTAAEENGSYSLTAEGTDGAGNSTTSGAVTVNVSNAAPTTMHIGDLDGASVNNGSTWTANVTILVVDSAGNPVSSATVSGSWSSGATGSASCTTNGSGVCTVSKSGIPKRNGSVTFTVTNVTDSLTYDLSANTDPDGDSNGTSITVSKA